MNNNINKKILLISLIFISLVLISAYVIEYKLGHKPCNLCIYERIPYFVSILLIIETIFFKTNEKTTLLLLSLVFFISACLAFYHFGIEQGFFKESLVCQNQNIAESLTKEQLLEELKNSNVSCKEVNFRIVGLSLATINFVISVLVTAISILIIKNEKNR